MNIKDHMTQEMLDLLISQDELQNQWRMCREMEAASFKAGSVSLPATAAFGEPVIHGARCVLLDHAEYWKWRRKAAEGLLHPLTVRALEIEYDEKEGA